MSTAVEVDSIVVNRGGRTVLADLSCRIRAGSITGLLGPSGSGKTTLIRAIVGIQRPRQGTVTVLGRPAGHRLVRHRVGYVPQTAAVYHDLTALDNVRYFAALYGASPTTARAAIADVGLADAAGEHTGNLSGGQIARVSLACALVGDPVALILDEPTVGQDPVLREELWHRFTQLAAAGTTLLISGHGMEEAARCHRLLLIRQGRILADDTVQGLRKATGTHDLDQAFSRLVHDIDESR